MVSYVVLLNWTDQGIRNIKKSMGRLKAAQKLAGRFDLRFKEVLYTLGSYDAVCILEGPDDASVTAFALAAGSLGNVRTTSMRAFSPEEMTELIKRL